MQLEGTSVQAKSRGVATAWLPLMTSNSLYGLRPLTRSLNSAKVWTSAMPKEAEATACLSWTGTSREEEFTTLRGYGLRGGGDDSDAISRASLASLLAPSPPLLPPPRREAEGSRCHRAGPREGGPLVVCWEVAWGQFREQFVRVCLWGWGGMWLGGWKGLEH